MHSSHCLELGELTPNQRVEFALTGSDLVDAVRHSAAHPKR